jgi:peptidoglycan/LPS O-acetylase OafA/YrhL
MNNSTEIKSLTGIRGIAAIYVIIFHWYNHLSQKQPITSSSTVNDLWTTLIKHGYLSVDLFFALSGFVLCVASYNLFSEQVSGPDYRKFIYKRFFRLFPLYICITLVYQATFNQAGVVDLLLNLTLLQGIVPSHSLSIINPGWSLTNEWVVCFIFPFFLFYALKVRKKAWLLVALSVVLLLAVSLVRGHAINWSNYTSLKDAKGFYPLVGYTRGPAGFARTITSFSLGIFSYIIYRFYSKSGFNLKYLGYLTIPLFALLFVKNADILIILLLPALILYITQTNYLNTFLSSKPVHFAGLISYSLYLNHFLFINTYDKVPAALKINSDLFSLAYILLSTFAFSVVTYYLIEKPGIALFKYRFKYKVANSYPPPSQKLPTASPLQTEKRP